MPEHIDWTLARLLQIDLNSIQTMSPTHSRDREIVAEEMRMIGCEVTSHRWTGRA
jgi:hypothetical protein